MSGGFLIGARRAAVGDVLETMERAIEQLCDELLLESTGNTRDRNDVAKRAMAQTQRRLLGRSADQRHEAFLRENASHLVRPGRAREPTHAREHRGAPRGDALLEKLLHQGGMAGIEQVDDQLTQHVRGAAGKQGVRALGQCVYDLRPPRLGVAAAAALYEAARYERLQVLAQRGWGERYFARDVCLCRGPETLEREQDGLLRIAEAEPRERRPIGGCRACAGRIHGNQASQRG